MALVLFLIIVAIVGLVGIVAEGLLYLLSHRHRRADRRLALSTVRFQHPGRSASR